jgi:hypothetical protein
MVAYDASAALRRTEKEDLTLIPSSVHMVVVPTTAEEIYAQVQNGNVR